MRLIHFSQEPFVGPIKPRREQRIDLKPNGLWVSDEDEYGWFAWSTEAEFRVDCLEHMSEIILAPDHNVLMIHSVEELDAFTAEYTAKREGDEDHPYFGRNNAMGFFIDWGRVAERYQGIVITPYLWERRIHPGCTWYNTHDVAGGCIWDPAAVAEVKPLGFSAAAAKQEDA